jgi:hypothetical protein
MFLILHDGLANSALLFMLVLAVWGFFRYLRGQGVNGEYLGALAVGEIMLLVQAGIGVLLYAGGARTPDDAMHILYGITNVISIPALYLYLRGQDGRREMLVWALMALFVFGLVVRARITGA